jgi:energy-coupling factor transport system permease protein
MRCKVIDAVHPAIRVVAFLIFSLSVSLGSINQFYLATSFILMLIACNGMRVLHVAWPMVWRLRWFFLSIALIYCWLTPGQSLWQGAPDGLPSREGVLLAVHRIAVLVLIVTGVSLLFSTMQRESLIGAFYWLASPLRLFGLSPERLAVRIVMALEYVNEVQALVAEQVTSQPEQTSKLAHYGSVAATVFNQVVRRGDESICTTIELEVSSRPPVAQWLLPLGLLMGFYAVNHIVM